MKKYEQYLNLNINSENITFNLILSDKSKVLIKNTTFKDANHNSLNHKLIREVYNAF
jgi:hypothetical protein